MTRGGTAVAVPPRTIAVSSFAPALVVRGDVQPAAGPARRTKIWEFNTNLHCSIIGTCLSTGELRQVLKKLGVAVPDSTDHELHGAAVSLAGRHDKAAKLLHKALDERHRVAINQFAKAATDDAVRSLWREAVRRGEIPGAYWATLTHPATTQAIIRDAFGEVHMLSHLVGAANRADIRRLCELEADNADLRARIDRQQLALRDAVVTRDARIQELRDALTQRIAAEPSGAEPSGGGEDSGVLRQLVADLERRLVGETRRSNALAEKLAVATSVLADERSARAKAEQEVGGLRRELDAIAASVLARAGDDMPAMTPDARLDGMTVLYVGGRQNQVAHLRAAVAQSGAAFLHHDGGIEHHLNLLGGLTSQADLVMFPVDCISHHAALAVKQLCRQAGKRFIPLRSASATSLLATLRQPDVTRVADAAD
ncbi:MAG TPA: DUF2325 domain-containing protein [Acetobacteraceae bacterium]|nr:DUF2325 domain-containing protein [Acetobacteraceae bacterium]